MIRKMVKIDEEKCNGCGLCVGFCPTEALEWIPGDSQAPPPEVLGRASSEAESSPNPEGATDETL